MMYKQFHPFTPHGEATKQVRVPFLSILHRRTSLDATATPRTRRGLPTLDMTQRPLTCPQVQVTQHHPPFPLSPSIISQNTRRYFTRSCFIHTLPFPGIPPALPHLRKASFLPAALQNPLPPGQGGALGMRTHMAVCPTHLAQSETSTAAGTVLGTEED